MCPRWQADHATILHMRRDNPVIEIAWAFVSSRILERQSQKPEEQNGWRSRTQDWQTEFVEWRSRPKGATSSLVRKMAREYTCMTKKAWWSFWCHWTGTYCATGIHREKLSRSGERERENIKYLISFSSWTDKDIAVKGILPWKYPYHGRSGYS